MPNEKSKSGSGMMPKPSKKMKTVGTIQKVVKSSDGKVTKMPKQTFKTKSISKKQYDK
jgi:hypothetical protein